jgi:2-phosphosulfolactate phosphatase
VTGARRQVAIAAARDLGVLDTRDAIVVVDVIRASTTLATALELGRRCYVAGSIDAARSVAGGLSHPLLAGELGGIMPEGFELNNSPSAIAARGDVHRPLVLLTTSGTRLLAGALPVQTVSTACLRNWSAEAERLLESDHARVALVGAATRGEFRDEDRLCCAWIAARLLDEGFAAADAATADILARWSEAPVASVASGHSADYLRRSGQLADLDYVLEHIDDLDLTLSLDGVEVVATPSALRRAA